MSPIYRGSVIAFLLFINIFATVISEGNYETNLETDDDAAMFSNNNSLSVIANKLGEFPGNYFKLVDNSTIIGYSNFEIFLIDITNKSILDSANCTDFLTNSYGWIMNKISNPFVLQSDRSHVICGFEIYEIKERKLNLKHTGWNVPDMDVENNTIMEITSLQNSTSSGCFTGVIVSFSILVNYNNTQIGSFCTFVAFSLHNATTIAKLQITTTYIDVPTMQESYYNGPCLTQASYWNWNNDIIILPSDSYFIYGSSTSQTVYKGTCLRFGDSPTQFLDGQYNHYFDAEKNKKCSILSSTLGTYLNDEYVFASSGSVDCLDDYRYLISQGGSVFLGWNDTDGDFVNDKIDEFQNDSTQSTDTDGDGYGDNIHGNLPDACQTEFGNSFVDRYGCIDTDKDGWSDVRDFFPNDQTQWNDSDLDGYGDSITGIRGDSCPYVYGTSNYNYTLGCPDQDFDGWADIDDRFPFDSSQWLDDDNDGYGNELNGFEGDSCPSIYGNSSNDRFGCLDSDGDGWSDDGDALPNNPTQWLDRDGDGYGDNQSGIEPDVFPTDGTQWIDFDGDGYGDNVLGNQGDAFPNDSLEWMDSDADGLGDNADMFPFDPTQTEDRDGDGMGDNPMGMGADKFPDDPTQWSDIDGDGYGDNPLGNNPDVFITDATQWFDRDGDGRGDNDQGRNYDRFPDNPTQWVDLDEDGLGDNQSGTNADPFLNDFDNDGYNDSIDILPKLASPGDLDADGCLDEDDAFPSNSQECVDTDGDGVGNNADSDDDGDGWTDADEERLGTDSLSASEQPVDSFEIVIPGTAVGLGAWDLIGIFGGIPLFAWIGFGFITRNGRCARYEELLKEATSRDELEQVALRWEYSLMLRMLGPHQGIRLERLRAELDDKFENATYDETEIGYDQTNLVENEGKDLPPINESITEPTKKTAATSTDESGYEWFKQGEENWYRPVGSNDEWSKFEN
ncbi:MAG: hypothetical protein ACPG73_01115 [Candidatus Poseidoniaceae archaeon]